MALKVTFREALALLLLSLTCCCCAGSLTPLIAWSNSNALSSVKLQQSPSVASLLDQSSLDGLRLLVVFKTDQLSFDDIVKYAGVYGEGNSALANLQGFVKNSHSSVWGGVDGYPARQLTDSLSQRLNVQPQTFGVEKLTVDSQSLKLVVVDLPSASGEEGFAKQGGGCVLYVCCVGRCCVGSFITHKYTCIHRPNHNYMHV